jgi:dihydrofolate reductase
MAKLIYSAITSLDGYVADEDGTFAWAAPDEQVHTFVNARERDIGTYLYGRRMYDTMVAWETMDTAGQSPATVEYTKIWQDADKVVFSRTLDAVGSRRTRIEHDFDPDTVRRWKESADRDLSIGGAEVAAVALRAGLVDEFHQFLHPVVVGGGTRVLPDHLRIDLELLDERRFDGGVVYLHYRVR